MLNLDTHVLLHAVAGRPSPAELRLLENDQWSISAIVLWEIAKLAQLGRIAVDLDDAEVVRTLARIHVWPITREIARTSTCLDVRSDPADELIGATSVVHKIPLVTRDRTLSAFAHDSAALAIVDERGSGVRRGLRSARRGYRTAGPSVAAGPPPAEMSAWTPPEVAPWRRPWGNWTGCRRRAGISRQLTVPYQRDLYVLSDTVAARHNRYLLAVAHSLLDLPRRRVPRDAWWRIRRGARPARHSALA